MKNKKSKYLLYALSAATLAMAPTVALVSASCVQSVVSKGEYVYEFNSISSRRGFLHDGSSSYGGYVSNATTQYTSGSLLRAEAIGAHEVSFVGRKQYITKPTFIRKRLELAKQVILTLDDGTVKVYDNDKAEILPEGDITHEGKKYYSSTNVVATSSDSRSINSKQFLEDLKKTKKFQVTIREDVHWVDHAGKKTEYKVQAKDFYYSWLRTALLTTSTRHANGGSEALDKLAKAHLEQNTLRYGTDTEYNNEYLYGVFGIDSSKFYDESSFIQTITSGEASGKQAVTFEKKEGATADFENLINKNLINNGDFFAAPSQYIDDLNEKKTQNILNYTGTSVPDNVDTFKEELEKIKDTKAYKAGVYWYGSAIENTLYAGNYYVSSTAPLTTELVKNTHYWDADWVKDETRLKKIIFKYQQRPQEKEIFSTRTWNLYKQGQLSSIPFSTLTQAQQQEAIRNATKLGLTYRKPENRTRPYWFSLTTPWVRTTDKANAKNFYGFSDAYGKMMWGGTKEELAEDKADSKTYFNGLGLSFRTILNAAINWEFFASQSTGGQGRAWLAKVAEASSIGGSDQVSNPKKPIDFDEKINSLFAIDVNGKKIDFGGTLGKELSLKENSEAIKNKDDITEKIKSAGFAKLKEEMKKVIDKFDQDNPTLKDQDFEYNIFYPYLNPDVNLGNAIDLVIEAAKALNPRIKLKFVFGQSAEDPVFNSYRYKGAVGTVVASWGYDYDSIGSGYDGLSWNGAFIPSLVKIKNDNNANFKEAFPKLSELAEDLAKYEESHKIIGSIPFGDFDKISNKYAPSQIAQLIRVKTKKDGEKYDLERTSDGKAQPYQPGEGKSVTDLYEWSSIFWNTWVKTKTNEHLAELMHEITSFLKVDFQTEIAKSNEEFSKMLIQPGYVAPSIIGKESLPFADWRILKK
ncbi:Uncharacterised protein [Metamycoplasma arthritidis]|uniref:OppA family ABC transporter substrate-binding lipoprotein n=1 Tax=Metamycoplasma arthritidis TaxID=2111 RepID=UPI001004FB61|nr:oligopeptide ABC transporter substrate-binding protein [Metamycoplasma arthritidis]VEU78791.1 Uncharacterised protein [Metamycoplasma arthritidis]